MKLLKNTLYNMSYQILIILIPMITMGYTARVLSPKSIGINGYTNSVVIYFVLFATLSVPMYGDREIAYVQDNKEARSKVFWELFSIKVISSIISITVFILCVVFLFEKHKTYTILQAILIIASTFDISWYFIGVEKFNKIVVRNAVVRIISVIAIFTLVKSNDDLWIYILIAPLTTLIANLSLWGPLKEEIVKIRIKELNLKKHFRPLLMLFLPQIVTQVYLNFNKTFLGTIDEVENGFFVSSDNIMRVVVAMISSFSAVIVPRVANMYSNKKFEELRDFIVLYFKMVTVIAILLMTGIYSLSHTFIPFFLTDTYREVADIMCIQAGAIILVAWANITSSYILSANLLRQYTLSSIAGIIANISVSFYCIPLYGARGAALAGVVTELAVTLIQLITINKNISFKYLFSEIWKPIIAGILSFLLVLLIQEKVEFNFVVFIAEGLVIVFTYFIILFVLKASVLRYLLDKGIAYIKR